MSKKEILNRQQAIDALTTIRMEWEEAVDSEPLVTVNGSVGLILQDVAQGIGLAEDERLAVLGHPIAD